MGEIEFDHSDNSLAIKANQILKFRTNNSERLRIDSGGRLLIGHTATDDRDGYNSSLQVSGTTGDGSSMTIGRWSNNNSSPGLVFSKSRNGAIGSHTVLQGGDYLGSIQFQGDDGTRFLVGASIYAQAASPVADYDMAADLVFSTNYGTTSPTKSMTLDQQGRLSKPNQPSFTARSTGTWSHGSSTGYLDIDINMVEEFDIGGNYNGQIFTAPVAGKYFFSYTFQYKCTSGYLVVSLRKGVSGSYSSYGRMHVYPPQQSTTYHGPGIIGIIDLAVGNTVKPVAEVNYAGNQVANVNFSGYLLG